MRPNRTIAVALALVFFAGHCWGADVKPTPVPEPYTKDSFPQWARDLRRTEIITFGSLPFVTLSVTLGFSLVRFAAHDFDMGYFPNPLAKNTDSAGLSTNDQMMILGMSAAISVAFGLTDLIVTRAKRSAERKGQRSGGITISVLPGIEQYADPDDPVR
jgi:preprotein translocase subunit SecE